MSYSVEPARYAQGCVAIRSEDGSGWKTREAGIAEAMGARYSNRENAYIMRATREKQFRAYADDARVRSDSFNERLVCDLPESYFEQWSAKTQ